jgi:hypothetical protein
MVDTNNAITSLSGRLATAKNDIVSLSGNILALSGALNTRIDAIQLTLS